jgi:DNA primase
MNVADFKSKFNLLEFVVNSGHYESYRGGAFVACPFHNDSSPSLLVHETRWHCFGCGKGGDALDFLVGSGHAYSVRDAMLKYGDSASGYQAPSKVTKVREYERPDPRSIDRLHRFLLKTPWAMSKLTERGISIPSMIKYRLGYGKTPKSSHKEPRFCIPFYDLDGSLITAKFRRDGDDGASKRDKYLSYYNTKQYLYNVGTCNGASEVVYCGGQFDAIVLEQLNLRAVGPASETMFAEEWATVFEGKRVLVLLDNDEAGREWTGRVCEIIPNSVPVSWPSCVPDGTDVTDAVTRMRGGGQMVVDIIKGR